MAGKLIKHLQEKAKEHPHLQLLNSQWNFDQELIPKALQNVASIFPHYSRHDASHSNQILINIERLLGDTLEKLTATDTWMLLEAAYWHDIGMLVSANTIDADLKSEEFALYLKGIATQKGNELQQFAKSFSSLNPANCFSGSDTPQQAVELYRQLLAGWYRKKHPTRSDEIVNDPWEKAGISSPRNELVPKRLFRLLGQICRLHGASFESVIANLPFSEAGMATEDCHPRFIACLLRLGDLFDLDDNRFCPVMLRTAGAIPPSSHAHLDKHAAIRHFRLDPEYVELKAECKTYEGYEATDQWFSWIKDELRDQMSCWKNIVPSREFGLLPTLGKMEVNLEPPNEILDPGERPHFGVDPEKTIELLQGAGLYESHWQSIRELLQNSVDATLLRIWLTHGEGIPSFKTNIDWTSPLSDEINKLFAQYPIEVELSREKKTSEDSKVAWKLEIRDRGIGISKHDLGHMRQVGASSKNGEKNAVIERMPIWMRPSGAFGIGLQSAFLITDQLQFETKSLLSSDSLSVRMTSPTGKERGMIYIRRQNFIPGRDFGSVLELKIETDAIPRRISYSHGESMTESALAAYDPILMGEIPYAATKLASEIAHFAEFSPLPINLKFDGDNLVNGLSIIQNRPKTRKYYHEQTGITLIEPKFTNINNYYMARIAFRGQAINKFTPRLFPFVNFTANLLHNNAPDTLTIDRNDVKESAESDVLENLSKALAGYINTHIEELDPEEQAAASGFLQLSSLNITNNTFKNHWENLQPPRGELSIKEICNKSDLTIGLLSHNQPFGAPPPKLNVDITIDDRHDARAWLSLLSYRWKYELKRFIQIDTNQENTEIKILKLSTKHVEPLTNLALKEFLLLNLRRSGRVGGRYACPCLSIAIKLETDYHKLDWCSSISPYPDHTPHFVLPFFFDQNNKKVTTDGLKELCAWVAKNARLPICEDEAAKLYNEFIKWVDDKLMKNEDEWGSARGKIGKQ